MPKIGSEVSLYFSGPDEDSAKAAAPALHKIAMTFGKGALLGAVSSTSSQLLRAGMTGQAIDWGEFLKTVGISAVSGGVSSLVAGGIKGNALSQIPESRFIHQALIYRCAGSRLQRKNLWKAHSAGKLWD